MGLMALTIALVACTAASGSPRAPEGAPAARGTLPSSGWSGDSLNPAMPAPPPQLVTAPATYLDAPAVTLAAGPFPVTRSLALRPRAATEEDRAAIRLGLERYLEALDRYRESGQGKLPSEGCAGPGCLPGGQFGAAVAAGLKASADPNVKRKFVVQSVRVDRVLAKPWGTRAIAEVTATIRDKAVDVAAEDQVETGRLRLIGDQPAVVDAWDVANGRWYNGATASSMRATGPDFTMAVGLLLRAESWLPASPRETTFGAGGETPYQKARFAYLQRLDTPATARTFVDVRALIEHYETFAEIGDGLATVRITGTVVTRDAQGDEQRTMFSRRAVVLFGQWMPEVVDEEIVPGTWLSGGDLALGVRDHNFA
jgi:hypothetical protein